MDGDVWFFDRFARLYDLAMPAADPDAMAAGLAVASREVERLLDVGGGTGRAARSIEVPERIVLDASRGMLWEVPGGIVPVLASATDLPMRAGSVDAVTIVDALHHLPRTDRVIAEATRVLAPGGALVVRDFDAGTLRGRLLAAAERAIGFDSRFFTARELREHMAVAGLDARVVERGFAYTVAGRKPGGP